MTRACIFFIIILYIVKTNGQSDRKSSLTFVIDVTSSMRDVIDQVEQHANAIVDAVVNSNESYIKNFILVTFADIEKLAANVNNVTVTKIKDDFKDALYLPLVSGGDCPENSMSGILTGVESSAPGSTIYVFTDASAKDFSIYDLVKDKAQKKEIQVIFVLTGNCEFKTFGPEGYKVYETLARDTSGQVFNLHKDRVADILKYLDDSIVSRRIILAAKSFPPGTGHTFTYTTDHDTRDTTVSVSCSNSTLTVKGPDAEGLKTSEFVKLGNVTVSKVSETKLGNHTVTIDCEADSRVIVTARAKIQFRHGFSQFVPRSLNDTTVKPAPDGKTYLSIKAMGLFLPQTVILLDVDDNIIPGYTIPLKKLGAKQNLFLTELFYTPPSVFRIMVIGVDQAYNETIHRIGTTLVEPQNPKLETPKLRKPTISIEKGPKIDIELGTPLQLKCSVSAYPKPNITWEKDGAVLETNAFDYDLPYEYVSVHKIDKVNENATYKCKAQNNEGSDEQSVIVNVIREAPLIDNMLKTVTFEEGTNATLHCRIIKGKPKPTIQWYYNDKVSSVEIKEATDQEDLLLANVNRTQAGTYKCVAKNVVASDSMELALSVEYAPAVDEGFKLINVKDGEDVKLLCSVDGVPEPNLTWTKDNELLTSKFIIGSDRCLRFKADLDDKGVYQCISKNKIGSTSKIIIVEVEKPAVILIKEDHSIDAEYGEALNITCEAVGYPTPEIVWTDVKNKTKLEAQVEIKSPYQIVSYLNIEKVTENATYQCKANNTLGNDEKNVTIQTLRKATFQVIASPKNKTYNIAYKNKYKFICKADAYPPAEVNWYKNGEVLSKDDISVSSDGSVLIIKNMQPVDAAKYMCQIKNIHHDEKYFFAIRITGVAKPKITATLDTLFITEDFTTKINCRIEKGTPKPNIRWYYMSKVSDGFVEIKKARDEEDLLLSYVKRIDQGTYKCEANNSLGNDSMETDLVVQYAPTIDNEFDTTTAKAGSKVKLACVVDGIPLPNVGWTKDDKPLFDPKFVINDDHGIVFNVDVEDRGIFKCSASNSLGTATKNLTLKVEISPTVYIEGAPKQQVDFGEALLLKCNVRGYPPPDISWTDITSHVALSGSTSTVKFPYEYLSVLNIDKVSKNTKYQCEAKNTHGDERATVVVEALIKIYFNIIEEPKDTTISYEAEGKLYCKVDAYPPANIAWYKDFSILTSKAGLKISSDGSVLTFEKMQPNQDGKYTCVATNSDNTKVSIAKVTISGVGPPSIKDDETSYVVRSGDKVDIPCEVHGKPTPTVKWTKNNSGAEFVTAKDHRFKLATVSSDTGDYTCTATNMYGTATRTVKINVYALEVKGKEKSNIKELNEEENLNLECISTGKPNPTRLEWFFEGPNDKPVNPPKELKPGRRNRLHIVGISFEQRGRYTCVAINKFGVRANFTYEVRIKTPVEIHNKDRILKAVDGDKALKIHCNATGYPKPYFRWIIDGSANTEVGDTIFLENISASHNFSKIICEARNNNTYYDRDTFTFNVVVDEYPSLDNPNSTLKVDAGQMVYVPCPVLHGKEDYLRWYKNNKKILNGELYLNKVKSLNAGLYTCRVSGRTKAESAYVLLEVTSKLRFKNTAVKTSLSLDFGEWANLDCLAVGDSIPQLSWSFNGRAVSKNIFLKFKMDQSRVGKYICEATNDIDSISRVYEVTINDCLLKIDPNIKYQPLILTQDLLWPSYKYDSGYLYMPQKQSITLACHHTSKFNLFSYHYVTAYCKETGGVAKLEVYGRPYDYSDIKCTEELKPRAEWTGKRCLGHDSETVKIAFDVLHKTIEVFEVCMNLSYDIPIYTKQNLHTPLADVIPAGVWFNDRLKHDYDQFYDVIEQIRGIPRLVRHRHDHCVFSKRQLVNPLDVFPGVPQKATFTHLNVVPHWGTCSSKNWNMVESRVRKLAESNNKLIVWTGTADKLKLKNAWGKEEDVVLLNHYYSSTQPVSTYLWKVVQNPAKRASLAIIQLNIPDITLTEARRYYVKCRDICHLTAWMKSTDWSDVSKGYTFCCTLKDFQNAFGYKVFNRMEDALIR